MSVYAIHKLLWLPRKTRSSAPVFSLIPTRQ